MNAYIKLIDCIKSSKSILCVGLDTDITKLPKIFSSGLDSITEFNKAIIDATKEYACAYKINFAFYEQYGTNGFRLLENSLKLIPDNKFIIADAKRGDIGNTSKAYATAVFDYLRADAITVNPYMGYDSIAPFLEYENKLTFILALTSNPGSNDFQRLKVNEEALYTRVIKTTLGYANTQSIGFVVGATHPEELAEIRKIAPNNFLLIPGIGTQGGNIEKTLSANNNRPAVINVSRDIIYASDKEDFAERANEKARSYRNLLGTIQ